MRNRRKFAIGLLIMTLLFSLITPVGAAVNSGADEDLDFSIQSTTAQEDLLLHYSFDEASGTTANDVSGNNHHGSLLGGASFSSGKLNNALTLNGSNGYVKLPDGIVAEAEAMTVSAWVKPNSTPAWSRIFDFGSSQTSNLFLTLNNGSTSTIRLGMVTGSAQHDIDGVKFPTSNSWQHIAITMVDKTAVMYLNGEVIAQNTNITIKPSDLGNSIANYIGRSQWPDPYYNGQIDDFRVYTRALNDQEIRDIMSESMTALEKLALDKNWLTLGNSTDLTSSIQLPTAAPMGSSIAWSSSHPEIISNTGEVTRPTSGDVEVSLTATLVHEALTDSKTFQFIVWEADAVAYQIEIDADQPLYEVNPTLFGLFYEDINYAGDGGLYGELIQNRSFEFSNSLESWTTERLGGAAAQVTSASTSPLNENNHKYARIAISNAGTGAGISNFGYTGIAVEANESYNFSFYARSNDSITVPMTVELRSQDNATIYASSEISGISSEWNKFETVLMSTTTDAKAKLVLLFHEAVTADIDMVSLFPQKTWMNRENGLRYDLAKMLDDMNPKFLRFPGGCIVENGAIDNIYLWKNTIGDVAERETQTNFWGYYQSFGLGYDEYFRFAEDIGAEPVPHIFSGILSCHSNPPTVPMNELQPYIDDALHLIEYANGDPETTEWGALRAANGHPEPYNLKYLGVGNETWGSNYFPRYKAFYDAIKAEYPEIKLILSAGAFPEDANFRLTYNWLGEPGDGNEADLVDEHMYQSPQWMLNNIGRYDNQDRNGPSVFVGEYAAHGTGKRNNVESALAEAAFMTGLERNSDIVEMAAYAPLFSRRPASFTQWTPDMIWFDEHRAFGTPNYYVQKEFMVHMGDQVLPVELEKRRSNAEPHTGSLMLGSWATSVEYDNISIVDENGNILYENDFSDPATLSDFSTYSNNNGDWVIENGVLKQTTLDEDVRLRLNGAENWSDYTITLDAKKVSGNEGFLIGFEAVDFDNYYWFNLGGWDNTVTLVERSVDNSKSDATSRLSRGVTTNQNYQIKIEVNDDEMRMYLDEEQLFTVSSPAPKYPGPLYSSTTLDEETGDIIVKVVNTSNNSQLSKIQVNGADYINPSGTVIEIANDSLASENSFEDPTATESMTSTYHGFGTVFEYEFPSYSVTILRLKTTEGAVIEEIEPVTATTSLNQAPQLPDTVTVQLSDNTTDEVSVEWRAIDQLSLNKPGVLELEGIVAGTYLEATAIITVLEEAIAEPLLEAYEMLTIPNALNIRGNITLPQQLDASEENVMISWSSSKSNVINAETSGAGGLVPAGVVTRGASDEQVTLTATLQWNGQSLTKTFNLTVKAAPQLEEYSGYIYTYFRSNLYGNGESQHIHLAASEDGLFWDDMNNNEPILESTLGTKGVRDSYVIRAPQGDRFYLIATDLDANGGNWGQYANNGSKSIMVWESDDLVNWSEQRMIEIAPEGAGNMWAPETIYDPTTGEYVVYWASNVSGEGHRIYYAKTRDFWTFTEPQVFKDRTASSTYIDTSMIQHDGTYYRFTKREQNNTILLETSDAVLGSYELVQDIVANQEGVEGPGIFKLNGEEKWILLMDGYAGSNAGVGFFPLIAESADDLASGNFRRLETHEFRMPTGAKHGSIIPVTAAEYEAIIAKWGQDLVQPVTPDSGAAIVPDLEYTFDESLTGTTVLNTGKSGASNNGILHNGASYAADDEKGNVLRLAGGNANSNSPYLEFPQGYFDGKDNVTIMMDIKSEMDNQYFFTFGVGQDNQKYLFLRTRANELYSALTVKSNSKEQTITHNTGSSIKNNWINVAIVLERDDNGKHSTMKLYRDGVLVGTKEQVIANLSTMGADLKAYLGKAFYADPYFKGSFDNVRVYNRALTDAQVAAVLLPPVSVEGISLDQSDLALEVGESSSLIATVTPNDAANKVVTFTSNNESVVSVSEAIYDEQTGTTSVVITAVAEGSAVITVTTEDGGFTATANVTVEADEVIVDEVSNVQVTAGDGQLALTWSEPEGIKQVKLTISEDEAATSPLTDPIYVDAGIGSYTFTNLTNGTRYYIHISTIDLQDNESAGVSVSGTPVATPPVDPEDTTPPSEVTGASVTAGDGQLTLSWTDPTDSDLASIIIKGAGDTELESIVVAKGAGSYTIDQLTNGQLYELLIVTVDLSGNESAGVSVSGTPVATPPVDPEDTTPPSEVTGASVTAGDGRLTLSWTDPTDSDLASIIIKGSGNTELESIIVAKGIKTHIINNLTNGTRYELLIITVDASGNESAGITVSGTPYKPSSSDGGYVGGSSGTPVQDTAAQNGITVGNNGQINVKPKVNEEGSIEVKLDNDILKQALQKSEDTHLTIKVEADSQVSDLSLELPLEGDLVQEMQEIDHIVISLGEVTVTLSTDMLNQAAANAKSLTLSVVQADSSKLPASTQTRLNGADIYDIELLLDGKPVSGISLGDVKLELPYTLKANEHPSKVVMYYINDAGELEVVMNAQYRLGTGTVVFQPSHLSKYTAVYQQAGFTDVKEGWAKEAIEALAARGIVKGVGAGVFNPNGNVTRAEFITMLINVFQLTDEAAAANFTDVSDGAWYSASIATAQKLGIVNGKPDGSFGVHDNITREDMAVMVYEAIKVKQLELTAASAAAAFDDYESIAAYAQQAVAAMQAEGIIKGMGKGKFAPKQNATRAQAVTIIYNLLSYL